MNQYISFDHLLLMGIQDFVDKCLDTEGLPFDIVDVDGTLHFISNQSLADDWLKIREYLRAYKNQLFYHPMVQLFFDAANAVGWLEHPPLDIQDAAFDVHEHVLKFNALVQFIQGKGQAFAFKERMRFYEVNRDRQELRAKALIDGLFQRYSRLLVLRIDFGMGANYDTRNIMTDFKEFKRRWNRTASLHAIVGYIAKLQFGEEKGYHLHALILLNGSVSKKDVFLARKMGELWIEVTQDRGVYFNCNAENYKDRYIGMIAHGDAVQRDMLKHIVLKYFFSDHQQVLVKKNAKDRTLFMSHPRSSSARTGRPRSKEDMALPSDMSMVCASPI